MDAAASTPFSGAPARPADHPPTPAWHLADRTLATEPPVRVGIVNVTEDSMHPGARSGTPARAIEDGLALAAAGFEMIDVGAVAARSGPPVPAAEEAARLVPAIAGLAERAGVPISADTFSPRVAESALDAGAVAINDIGGGTDAMLELAAGRRCGLVLMHIEGPPRSGRSPRRYEDPVERLRAWFSERLEAAAARGLDAERIVLDPGLDFDLTVADGLEVLRRLPELAQLGRPLYVSLSRKDLLGAALAGSWRARLPAEAREWATAAAAALAVAGGAGLLRLHDRSAADAVRVAERIVG